MNKGYFTDVDDDTMRLGTFYYAGGKMPSVIFNFVLMITPPCDHIGRTVHPAYNYIHANYKFKY